MMSCRLRPNGHQSRITPGPLWGAPLTDRCAQPGDPHHGPACGPRYSWRCRAMGAPDPARQLLIRAQPADVRVVGIERRDDVIENAEHPRDAQDRLEACVARAALKYSQSPPRDTSSGGHFLRGEPAQAPPSRKTGSDLLQPAAHWNRSRARRARRMCHSLFHRSNIVHVKRFTEQYTARYW